MVEGARARVRRVKFDSRVYELASLKSAAYRFLKAFTADISKDGDLWICDLTFRESLSEEAMAQAEQELRAEVLDQDLRLAISRETEAVRNAVLALAFSRTGLQSGE